MLVVSASMPCTLTTRMSHPVSPVSAMLTLTSSLNGSSAATEPGVCSTRSSSDCSLPMFADLALFLSSDCDNSRK